MVLLVLVPVVAEALDRAVVAQVLRDLAAQADRALQHGLLVGVHAALRRAARGDAGAVPARAQLDRPAFAAALLRDVVGGHGRLAALDEHVGLERDAADGRVPSREPKREQRDRHACCGNMRCALCQRARFLSQQQAHDQRHGVGIAG